MVGHQTWLGSWMSGIHYLWAGPEILLQYHVSKVIVTIIKYLRLFQNTKSPYALRTPETYYVHFSSESHVKELVGAPEERLSLHALSKDVWASTSLVSLAVN